jgi:hypothetical protein
MAVASEMESKLSFSKTLKATLIVEKENERGSQILILAVKLLNSCSLLPIVGTNG